MININIPGFKNLEIKNLVIDYNGTAAVDGTPVKGLKKRIKKLSESIDIHVITADTHGNVKKALSDYNCRIIVISGNDQDNAKKEYIKKTGSHHTAALGNGRNDILMLSEAALGISVLMDEGCSFKAVAASDLIVKSVNDALDLFLKTNRLKAGLRNG
jgi:soluble P-type ATPase